jgi:hypothetical protein
MFLTFRFCRDWEFRASNQIGQQPKITMKIVSEISQHLFAKFREIIVKKFREINCNFVLMSYFAK